MINFSVYGCDSLFFVYSYLVGYMRVSQVRGKGVEGLWPPLRQIGRGSFVGCVFLPGEVPP